jgi:hypothetical protein
MIREQKRLQAEILRLKADVAACTASFLLLCLILLNLPR